MEWIWPDKTQLQDEYLIKYGQEFLQLNNLKVGDTVQLEFPYEGVSQKYKSREFEKFGYKKKVNGILKTDELGRLFAESIDNLVFYIWTSNNRTGRDRKGFYKEVHKKSIVKFGTDFINF